MKLMTIVGWTVSLFTIVKHRSKCIVNIDEEFSGRIIFGTEFMLDSSLFIDFYISFIIKYATKKCQLLSVGGIFNRILMTKVHMDAIKNPYYLIYYYWLKLRWQFDFWNSIKLKLIWR